MKKKSTLFLGFLLSISLTLSAQQENVIFDNYLIGTISRAKKFEQITYGWVNPTSPTLPLQHNYWYKFTLMFTLTGGGSGDQVDVVSSVFNLGLTGTDPQILIGSSSGSFNDS